MAIQGDLQQARQMLQAMPPEPSADHLELENRFRHRFVQRSEALSPDTGINLLDQVVAVYRDYWARSLLAEMPLAESESMLEDALHQALSAATADAQADDVYTALGTAIETLGYGVLAIPAPPLQDLFIWGGRRDREYSVTLTDHSRIVQVAFMSEFVSLGWKDYAALGMATTTGWVEDGVLYCVERAYVPGTERFEVSYLKHEARHLADLERFPGLRSVDLEYRAKLTELAFAAQTLNNLLDDFTAKSAPNPDSPHAEANLRVLRDLHEDLFGQPLPEGPDPWNSVRTGQVNAAARRLLRENTEALERRPAQATP